MDSIEADTPVVTRTARDLAVLVESRTAEGDRHLARLAGLLAPAVQARYGRDASIVVTSRSTWTTNDGPVSFGNQWLAAAQLTGEHAGKRACVELVRRDDTKISPEEVWLRFVAPDDCELNQAWIVSHPDVGEVQVVQRSAEPKYFN